MIFSDFQDSDFAAGRGASCVAVRMGSDDTGHMHIIR